MKKEINNFLEEITDNFSELFVETYFLRYLSNYGEDNLFINSEVVLQKVEKKLVKKMQTKLNEYGFDKEEIEKNIK